ncbi:CCA tRNA nucleotidyltransferase [Porcipelethomonas sp.]|uniref:CCA tRNA nucleotidyltransferase n=1 Tax=Porcipelethomonas sp. TaxID=2981675 RepID=UPI003EF64009
MFSIPDYIYDILNHLEKNGFEAYIVGGCVRDFFLSKTPHDFDITTNALPEEIKKCLDEYSKTDYGEKHGTVAVIAGGHSVEITTYRIDGKYTDSRHPDNVFFTSSLNEDLKRRDFTINSMAVNKEGILTDPFNGKNDLGNGIIRTVGNAHDRFSEDALRILRAIRFSSQLGFRIENETSMAVHSLKYLIKNISMERIREEFIKIVTGKNSEKVLREYADVIAVFIPEIKASFGFRQYSPYHKYDVWEHTIHAVSAAAEIKKVKIAMFFHDISKPECFKMDENGRGHFKGHAQKSALKAVEILKRLKFSHNDINDIVYIISHHSDELNTKAEIKMLLNQIGEENFFNLLDVQRADSMSKQDFCRERLKKTDVQEKTAIKIIENKECYRLKDLAVNGNDLIKLGLKNEQIGLMLNKVLNEIINEKLENSKEFITKYIISTI